MPPRDQAGIAGTCVRSGLQDVPRVPATHADIPRMPLAVQDVLGPEIVKPAEAALADAGLGRAEAVPLGCVTASHHATAATAQYIAAVLDGAGPRWLAPQCFLHYSPHSLTGRLCIDLGLDGTAVTLTGTASGVDALGYAAMLVETGRCPGVLVAAAHWPTPAPGAEQRATRLTAAAAVVTAGVGHAVLDAWQPGGGHPAVAPEAPAPDRDGSAANPDASAHVPDSSAHDASGHEPADVTAPLADLCTWHDSRPGTDLTLTGGGSRLTVRAGGPR